MSAPDPVSTHLRSWSTDEIDAAVRSIEQRQLEVLEQLPHPVVVSIEDRVEFANASAFELFGIADLNLLTHRINNLEAHRPEDRQRILDLIEQRSEGIASEQHSHWWIVRPDGTERYVRWATIPTSLRGAPATIFAVVDITASMEAFDAVAQSESRQHQILDVISEGIIAVDGDGICIEANRAGARILGLHEGEELLGAHADQMPLVDEHGDALTRAMHPVWRALDDAEHIINEVFRVRFGTSVRFMRVTATPIESIDSPRPTGALITYSDVTEEIESAAAVAASEARFRHLAAVAPVGIFETDAANRCIFVNDRWCDQTGLSRESASGDGWLGAIHPEDRDMVAAITANALDLQHDGFGLEFRFLRPDGVTVPVQAETAIVRDQRGQVQGFLGTTTDLTSQVKVRDHLNDLAHRDTLTGLLNRRALVNELRERLAAGTPTSLLFCDLDGFKLVNDTFGHDAGDEVLIAVAARLLHSVRDTDIVARLAGDEFVMVAHPNTADEIAERLMARIAEPIPLGAADPVTVGMSIGISRFTEVPWISSEKDQVEHLLRLADEAMYEAKRNGKGRVVHATLASADGLV